MRKTAQAVCVLMYLLLMESYGGLAVRISNLTEVVKKQAAGDASQEEYILREFGSSAVELAVTVVMMAVFAYIDGRPLKGGGVEEGKGGTGSGGGKDSGSEGSGSGESGSGSGDSGESGTGSGGGKDSGSEGSGSGESGSGSGEWWHEGYVDNLSDTQILLGVKQSGKGLSTLGSATRENAMSAGKAWVGENYNIIKNSAGDIQGFSSADKMRAFRIQFKPKEGIWRANFQENIMVNNSYPNTGQHVSELKNVHIDILD